MLAADAEQFCGKRYQRHADRQGYRWGMIGSEVGWHGGQAAIRRPRVRERGGAEVELASWRAIQNADLLSRWAFNQMLIGVATRKYARSIRLSEGDLAGQAMRATTKSSVSRRSLARKIRRRLVLGRAYRRRSGILPTWSLREFRPRWRLADSQSR
jgi:hypothetical protein